MVLSLDRVEPQSGLDPGDPTLDMRIGAKIEAALASHSRVSDQGNIGQRDLVSDKKTLLCQRDLKPA